MKRVDIKITFACNNRCRFCVQGEKREVYSDKDTSVIQAILRKSKKNYEQVIFTGGEPTIRKDIIDLVAFARKMGYNVQIQTNGRMFAYLGFCGDMMAAGANEFAISLHGHNAPLHDSLTGVKGSFLQTVQGIKNLLSFNVVLATNTVINKHNYRFLPRISEFLMRLGVGQYQISFPHILGCARSNQAELIPRKTEVMPYVIKAIESGLRKNRTPKIEAIPPCFLKDYHFCITDGYIPYTTVFDVKKTADFNRWRKESGKIKGPACRKCRFYRRCEGPWREYPALFGWDEFIPVV